jgi:cyclopropane-fatty-acyl-phospholipid synthase
MSHRSTASRSVWQGAVERVLDRVLEGSVTLSHDGAQYRFGDPHAAEELASVVDVRRARLFRRVALESCLGVARAYIDGDWSSPDLTRVLRVFLRNRSALQALDGWSTAPVRWLAYLRHLIRDNSRSGSRRNIASHYDLSNEFFALFLDDTMTYSCGIFEKPQSTMRDASVAKYDRLCRKLALSPKDHLLEIGTGWGGLALHAATHYGCRVTTTTISAAQHAYAAERIRAAGLADRVQLLRKDYRQLEGQYDKLISIEMIEAVGHRHYETFFATCNRLLKPAGIAALQVITIADRDYDRQRRSSDFIKAYVFPGSCIPSVTRLSQAMARVGDLRLYHLEDITPHYAETLRRWRDGFLKRLDAVRRLGFDDRFVRTWLYYLAYCEAGFAERYLGNVQMVLTRDAARPAEILPPLPVGGAEH